MKAQNMHKCPSAMCVCDTKTLLKLVNCSHVIGTVLRMILLRIVFLCLAGCNYFKTKDFKYFMSIKPETVHDLLELIP